MLIRTMMRLQEPDTAPSGGGSTPSVTPSATPTSTPAPASAPVSTPSSSAPASSASEGTPVDDFDFGALVDNVNSPDDGDGAPPPKAAATPSSVPPAATTPPVAATPPVAVPPVAATPPVQPAGQPPVPASQTPAATEGNQTPPEPFDVAKHRAEFLPKLESLYKMTDQEVADFQTNPGEALPKLAARLHYETQLAVHQGILQILPHLMGNYMEGQNAQRKNEDAFYGRWPELKEAVTKDPKNEASIQEAIRSYKALNPKAPIGDVIEKAGLLALISMGIPPRQAATMMQTPAPIAAPVALSMPARPAGTGASAHVPMPTPQGREDQGGEALFGAIADHWANGG